MLSCSPFHDILVFCIKMFDFHSFNDCCRLDMLSNNPDSFAVPDDDKMTFQLVELCKREKLNATNNCELIVESNRRYRRLLLAEHEQRRSR